MTLFELLRRNGMGYSQAAPDDGSITDRGDDFEATTTEEEETENEEQVTETGTEETVEEEEEKLIPKSRFDAAVRKERALKEDLERRVKEYEERDQRAVASEDLSKAEALAREMIKQHTALIADGELDKAADIMEKILQLNSAVAARRADAKTKEAKAETREEIRYEALVAKLEADHPEINPDSEAYDADTVELLQATVSGYVQRGMSPSQALSKAVERIMGKPDNASNRQKAEELGMRRRKEGVEKALAVKGKQPARTSGVGTDHDKVGGILDAAAIMKMSQDEFAKLPESKLREMRGDFIE